MPQQVASTIEPKLNRITQTATPKSSLSSSSTSGAESMPISLPTTGSSDSPTSSNNYIAKTSEHKMPVEDNLNAGPPPLQSHHELVSGRGRELATLNQKYNDDSNEQLAKDMPSNKDRINGDSTDAINNQSQQNKTTKLNGLKNRIIQRPPPLILDKVSNFYDNETNDVTTVATTSSNTDATNNNDVNQPTNAQRTSISKDLDSTIAANHNANQKFWASLNQNAKARNFANATNVSSQMTSNVSQIEQMDAIGQSPLGADLIITHRSSTTSINVSKGAGKNQPDKLDPTKVCISSRSGQSEENMHSNRPSDNSNLENQPEAKGCEEDLDEIDDDDIIDDGNISDVALLKGLDLSETEKSEFDDSSSAHVTSHLGAGECNGGNLIGVDNSTPPASAGFVSNEQNVNDSENANRRSVNAATLTSETDELPTSASSNRPRSNNPFLSMDDEDLAASTSSATSNSASAPRTVNKPANANSDIRNNNISYSANNFHHRPASFIAATGRTPLKHTSQRPDQQHPLSEYAPILDKVDQDQRTVQKQLDQMNIYCDQYNSHINSQRHFVHAQQHESQPENPFIFKEQQAQLNHNDLSYSSRSVECSTVGQETVKSMHQHNIHNLRQPNNIQAVHNIYSHETLKDQIIHQPIISIDSESAACKPPPIATMQLPYWTEAIYELNNAVLDLDSVTGGSENGQFIHIVGSGDIIMELDDVKVSGYTLNEFNVLVESKPTHKLSAVQTNHSQGLTIDLKHYLSLSFPKSSADKKLQDLVRENIYRKTIPCTTRRPKEGEVDGVDYHFLTREKFIEMDNKGMLLECGMYGGHLYGLLKPFSDVNSVSSCDPNQHLELTQSMHRPLNVTHPALGMNTQSTSGENLYENYESMKTYRLYHEEQASRSKPNETIVSEASIGQLSTNSNHSLIDRKGLSQTNLEAGKNLSTSGSNQANTVSLETQPLPHGWERVIDPTHGTYYIDHNTQQTQYERPYEIQLTKGQMGFGFTLVEAENGALLVRSIIPGGPAHMNGSIRPGDLLISAVGVPVAGLQHTDIARLFSTFAVGDRVRLTFARTTYVFDDNLVPDEYLFSNGTNGDLALAVNPNNTRYHIDQAAPAQSADMFNNQEDELIRVILKRGDQGFGFTISDSNVGQKVRKIQNTEVNANLKQGDVLISLNGVDITNHKHKEVVERLKSCPVGQDVTLVVKRKKRFRSKTPTAFHTDYDGYYSDNTPQRNCKTPSLDGLMLRRRGSDKSQASRGLFRQGSSKNERAQSQVNSAQGYHQLSDQLDAHSIYSAHEPTINQLYSSHASQHMNVSHLPATQRVGLNPIIHQLGHGPGSIVSSDSFATDQRMNSLNPADQSIRHHHGQPLVGDKQFVMMSQQHSLPPNHQHYGPQNLPMQTSDYHQMPVYSNSDLFKIESNSLDPATLPLPMKPMNPYLNQTSGLAYNVYANNYYANNQEIALQRQLQYNSPQNPEFPVSQQGMHPIIDQFNYSTNPSLNSVLGDHDEYETHHIDLDRGSTDSNWGIRLIGGSEVDRAISIGSIVFGGAASKNGKLKSGDEILSINGVNVVGATHQHVVELISACSNRASLVVRRRRFADACEVVLNRNMDEGFGFVIISSGNCALIGRIIEGSPADRCQQLHVKDRIIAVNGRYITPDMQHPEIVNMIKDSGSTLHLSIIPADCYTVELIKSAQGDNFGFSMRGGSEYDGTPLYILRVAPDGLARDLLNVGDQILEINNIPTVGMTHQQAASIIKYSDPIVKLKLRRNYVTPASLLVDSPRALQKFNQVTAEMKTINQAAPMGYAQDGSISSEFGSSTGSNLPALAPMVPPPPISNASQMTNGNGVINNQNVPLYAS